MKKILIVSAIVVFVAAGIVLVRNTTPHNDTVRIGAALALTGDAASWGEVSLKGTQMAVDEINNKGGIAGKQVELIVEDTKSSAQGSIAAVQKLTSVDGTNAIVGPTWLDVYQGAQGSVAGKNVAMITADSGVEAFNVPDLNKNVFSSWYRSQPKAELLAKFLVSKNVKRLVMVHQNDSYYNDLGSRVEAEAVRNGITIVRHESVNAGEGDFKTLLTKIKADDADMIFFALYDQKSMDAFFKNCSQLGLSVPLVTDEFGQDYVSNPDYVKSVDGMHFFSATRQDDSFEKAFKEKYGTVPVFGASNAYDSVMILAEALEKSPNDLAGYLRKTSFKTVTFGNMNFDEINGVSTKNETYVMKVIKGADIEIIH